MPQQQSKTLPIPEVPTEGNVLPMPHHPGNTEYVRAGGVTIGVEARVLTYEIAVGYLKKALAIKYDATVEQGLNEMEAKGTSYEMDVGVSVHVLDESNGRMEEYLRFDCFDGRPHLHTFLPHKDGAGNGARIYLSKRGHGDPVQWTMDTLRAGLAPLLRDGGASHMADRLDQQAVAAAMPQVERAVKSAEARLPALVASV